MPFDATALDVDKNRLHLRTMPFFVQRSVWLRSAVFAFLGFFAHCHSSLLAAAAPSQAVAPTRSKPTQPGTAPNAGRTIQTVPRVLLGIDVLEANGFAALRGKRIGLLTHPAGVDSRGVSTITTLRNAPGVKLVALYAVEHGIYN